MAGLPSVLHCANHLDRAASGRCVQCRTPVCAECSTRLQGINYCSRCVEARARVATRRAIAPVGPWRSAAFTAGAILFSGAIFTALFYALGFFWFMATE